MTSFDALFTELSDVLRALEGEDDDAARTRLEARRDELREVLRSVDIDRQRPTGELAEEHSRLEARLKAARNERVKKVPGKFLGAGQTVGGGIMPAEINRLIDEGNRFDELLERYEHLSAILRARGAL